MKAVLFTKYGSVNDLQFKEVDKPMPQDDEVLIKVHAASVNSWDWELLIGKPFVNRMMFGLLKPTKIQSLGCDVAGQVEEVGRKVTKFKNGDAVYGDLSGGKWGGFAEYVCATEAQLVLKSKAITFEQAAAVPQAALLALQGLRFNGQLQAGQKVLMNGGGGGVGTFAIQLAKLYNAEVTAVDNTEKQDLMRSMGADHIIDYTEEDFTANGQQYDLILDVAANRSVFKYKHSLTPNGAYAMIGGSSSFFFQLLLLKPWISITSRKKMGLLLHKANEGLDDINQLFEEGKIKSVIDKHYTLNEVDEAIRYFAEIGAKGKIVINIAGTR